MPSPFPGMDPWLEDPALFPDLHDSLVVYLREVIQARLPKPYFTAINSYVWLDEPERYVQPDVDVLRAPGMNGGGTAIATESLAEAIVIPAPLGEPRTTFLEIRAPYENERLVTSVEVLSWKNKSAGRRARDLYHRKQEQVMSGQANLVEIDLLRGGTHATSVPRAELEARASPFDYHVCVRRIEDAENSHVYTVRMQDRLPKFPIPLLPQDGAIPIDLQAVFDRTYDAGPYRQRVRYADRQPVPPLTPEQDAWAAEKIRAAGLLPTA
jgi:hypothetical protein